MCQEMFYFGNSK